MKYTVILDRPKASTQTYLFILAHLADGRLKYPLKEKILPSLWNAEHQRPAHSKDKKINEAHKAISRQIDRVTDRLDELINEAKKKGKSLLKADVKWELDLLLERKVVTDHSGFFKAWDLITEDMKSGKLLTPAGKVYSQKTLENYRDTHTHLKVFSETHSLDFPAVTLETYRALVAFLNDKSASLNYVGMHIKHWKRIIDIAHVRGWHNNLIYQHKDFKTPSEETFDIFLTSEELDLIYQKELEDKRQAICRDWFIIDCFTGLRVSDLKLLNDQNITGSRIVIANEKTDTTVVIPVHPYVTAIRNKYSGAFPPPMNNKTLNKLIKKVGEACKINKTVLYTVTEGGVRKDYYMEKWKMISNHTARRSFITNLIKLGYQDSLIMKLTGIKRATTLQRYNKLSAEEVADVAANLPFFK